MSDLTAFFDLSLEGSPGFLIGEDDEFSYSLVTQIGDYRAAIELSCEQAFKMGPADNPAKRYQFDRLRIALSRSVTDDEVDSLKNFFSSRRMLNEYHVSLLEGVNRLLTFFKYRLRNPLVRLWGLNELLIQEDAAFNPRWTYKGVDVTPDFGHMARRSGVVTIKGGKFVGDDGFGIKRMIPSLTRELTDFLQNPREVDLFSDLLSEAQAAAVVGNLRRAVLELAVAVEVCTKEKAAARGMSHTQLKGTSVVELLKSGVGNDVSASHPREYGHMVDLFRARNSVAHNGKADYRDSTTNTIVELTADTLRAWWDSALNVARALGRDV